MRRFLILSTTIALALQAGCGGDDCGPGGAPSSGLVAGNADVAINFGGFMSGVNNDCSDPATPDIISLTINATQVGGAGLLTLCVPHPDLLADGVPLDRSTTGVRVVDLNGEADGCAYTLQGLRPTAGTVKASGLCDLGADKAGFALTVDGNLSLDRDCGTSTDTIAVTLSGTVAVAVP
jgi:hypothetical protein